MVLYIGWFAYALIHGFLAMEIANSFVVANIMMAVFGGVYCIIGGNDILAIYTGESIMKEFFSCTWYAMRYAFGAAAVGFVIKNTR